MLVLYFAVFILLDVFHMEIANFFWNIYLFTNLGVFEFVGSLVYQNTFLTRFIILIPLVFVYAFYGSRTGKYS